jgi:hypothetical protein
VPITLVFTNGHGECSELSLCDSAAKCTTASQSATAGPSVAASQMSPWMKSAPVPSTLARLPA